MCTKDYDYYFSINYDEYMQCFNKYLPLSRLEKENIVKMIGDESLIIDYDVSNFFLMKSDSGNRKACYTHPLSIKKRKGDLLINKELSISKLKDEWYLCVLHDPDDITEIDFYNYKCDRLDGLMKCINDIF